MLASDIMWDVDMDSVMEQLHDTPDEIAAAAIGQDAKSFAALSRDEKEKAVRTAFEADHKKLNAFCDLPDEVTVPDGMTDEDEISDWLSDTYGFCHLGFVLETD